MASADVATWPTQPSRLGKTLETLRATFLISDPRQRWVTSRRPPISPALAIAEVAWILAGDNRLSYLTPWNRDHAKFVGDNPQVYGSYGHRLRQSFGVDQLLGAASALRSSPDSRQVVLQLYDPRLDLPLPDGSARAGDIPCNVTSLLKVRNNRLEWTQILRSNDLHLGVPYNFVQFTTIQEVLAGMIGVELGSYAHYSDSLHVYEKDGLRGSKHSSKAPEENDDDLRLPLGQFEAVLRRCHACIDELGVAASEGEVVRASAVDVPSPWKNLGLICAAERARRLGCLHLMQSILQECTNDCLRFLQQEYADLRSGTSG
jgi:thymidylate synthase